MVAGQVLRLLGGVVQDSAKVIWTSDQAELDKLQESMRERQA